MPSTSLRVGDLRLNLETKQTHRGQQLVELTDQEFRVLSFLMAHRSQILPRSVLLENCWPAAMVAPKVVDVYIGYLRRKIDRPGRIPLIHAVRGLGYVIKE